MLTRVNFGNGEGQFVDTLLTDTQALANDQFKYWMNAVVWRVYLLFGIKKKME